MVTSSKNELSRRNCRIYESNGQRTAWISVQLNIRLSTVVGLLNALKDKFIKTENCVYHFNKVKLKSVGIEMHTPGSEANGFFGIFVIQVTFVIFFGIFVRYDYEMLPMDSSGNFSSEQVSSIQQQHRVSYPRKFEFKMISLENVIKLLCNSIVEVQLKWQFHMNHGQSNQIELNALIPFEL